MHGIMHAGWELDLCAIERISGAAGKGIARHLRNGVGIDEQHAGIGLDGAGVGESSLDVP
jgi:hypothetical protein